MSDVMSISAYDELAELMTTNPNLEAIMAFQLSAQAQQRLSELLTANRSRRLSDSEVWELDEYVRVEHLVRKAKILAYEKLNAQ
jgi:hypothetical protein